jgi:YggT family protein
MGGTMNGGGTNAFSYLVSTLFDLYILAVLLRLLLQWVRADFYNPICQFLVRVTSPVLVPLRRLVPSIGRLDTASVLLLLALQFVGLWLISLIQGAVTPLHFLLLMSVVKLLSTLLWTYFVLIIVMVVLSWFGARVQNPAIPLLYQLTEPVLRPFRRIVPPISGIDLSPLFALIAIRFLLLLLG